VPGFAPVFVQNHVKQCNILHLMYFNLYWYKGIQISVNLWKSQFETHNQGVAGSSPAGPTVDNQPLGVTSDWLVFLLGPGLCHDLIDKVGVTFNLSLL
jgi:hypothetical protein